MEPGRANSFKFPPPCLGAHLPQFKITFLDARGEVVPFVSTVQTSIKELTGTLKLGYVGEEYSKFIEEPIYLVRLIPCIS